MKMPSKGFVFWTIGLSVLTTLVLLPLIAKFRKKDATATDTGPTA